MKLTIEAEAKEIADLVVALQDRPEPVSEEMMERLMERKEWLKDHRHLSAAATPPLER